MPKTPITILNAAALSANTANTANPSLPELAHAAMTQLLTPSPGHPVTLSQTALILGTTLGCLETDREFDRSRHPNPRFASPAAFAKTLPSTLPAQLALTFHLTAPSLLLSAGNASAALALRRAALWMHCLNLPHAIAGGFDSLSQNPTTPPTCRIALLLLTTDPVSTRLGTVTFAHQPAIDACSHEDASLEALAKWIRDRIPATLPAGVNLNP